MRKAVNTVAAECVHILKFHPDPAGPFIELAVHHAGPNVEATNGEGGKLNCDCAFAAALYGTSENQRHAFIRKVNHSSVINLAGWSKHFRFGSKRRPKESPLVFYRVTVH